MTKQERIAKHIDNLKKIFPTTSGHDSTALAANLRTLERRAHRSAERLCNDSSYSQARHESLVQTVLRELNTILDFKNAGIKVFINSDARGYALKIDDAYVRALRDRGMDIERDWGGYGIIWPDFDEK